MAEGWICPRCQLVLAPHVNEHRCDPPATPVTGTGGGGGGPWPGSVITVTGGTSYQQGVT
jgi:hypothetical protein